MPADSNCSHWCLDDLWPHGSDWCVLAGDIPTRRDCRLSIGSSNFGHFGTRDLESHSAVLLAATARRTERDGLTIASSEQEAASTPGSVFESVSRCLLSLTQALAVKKPFAIAIVSVLLLAVIGAVALLRPPSLQSSARRAWKAKSIADIAARIADPSWPTNELAHLKPQSTNDESEDASWLSEHIIVTRKGEWLAFANICQKQDDRIPDIFLARGSDGAWYYSTYHFCVGMVVLRMEEQPEDLATFAKTHFLQMFDGSSDDCLQKTWPPTTR